MLKTSMLIQEEAAFSTSSATACLGRAFAKWAIGRNEFGTDLSRRSEPDDLEAANASVARI